ncbi:MAG: GNAT family N-acetyltransferase [Rubripirellula sp.]
MIQKLAKTEVDRRLSVALIETDRSYFEMAAEMHDLSIGKLVWMPGLNHLASSCVVHRIEPDDTARMGISWLDEVESALRSFEVPRSRLYFDEYPTEFATVLKERGYQHRGEIGFLAPVGAPSPPSGFRLCRVRTDDDWKLKRCLHEEAMEGPDGYTNQADHWVEMERRKCANGSMRSYLVRHNDEIVATVGAIVTNKLLRLKNIVVAANMRRRGIGHATVQLLWQLAETQHSCRLGVYGVEHGKGSRMYRRAGLYEVNEQHEWSRIL